MKIKNSIFAFSLFILIGFHSGFSQVPNERELFEYGKKLLADQLYDLSAIQFTQFLEHYPDSPLSADAQYFLAESYFNEQDFNTAYKQYLNLMMSYPNSDYCAEALYKMGVSFKKQQIYSSSIESYFRTYLFYPKSPWADKALLNASQLALEINAFDRAESMLLILIDQAKNASTRTEARLLLACVNKEIGKFEQAIAVISRIQRDNNAEPFLSRTFLILGQIYQEMGHIGKSEDAYKAGLIAARSDSMKQQVACHLGNLLYKNFQYTEAKQYYEQAAAIDADPKLKINCMRQLGSLQIKFDAIDLAIQSYNQCLELPLPDSTRNQIQYQLALAYRLNKQYDLSESILLRLVSESVQYLKDDQDPLLLVADLYDAMYRFTDSVQKYGHWLKMNSKSELMPYVLYHMGELYLDQLQLTAEGLSCLQKVWQKFPTHFMAISAKMKYAEGLETVKRYHEARQMYRFIQNAYPGSREVKLAKKRMRHIPSIDSDMIETLASHFPLKTENQAQWALSLARLYHFQAKDYSQAIVRYHESLGFISNNLEKNTILNSIGDAYQLCYDHSGNPAYKDSAVVYYRLAKNQSPVDRLSLILLETEDNPHQRIRRLRSYHAPDQSKDAIFRLSEALFRSDSLDQCISVLRSILSVENQQALLLYGMALKKQTRYLEADSILQFIPKGEFSPRVLSERASIHLKLKNNKKAIHLYQSLCNEYPFSRHADSTRSLLGHLYLSENQYVAAQLLFQKLVRQDSLQKLAHQYDLLQEDPDKSILNLLGLAQAFEGSTDLARAKRLYLKCLYLKPDQDQKELIYRALSRIAEQEGNLERSIHYLEQVSLLPGIRAVHEDLGELYFQSGQFADASQSYRNALETVKSDSVKMVLNFHLIRCLLKQNQIPQANTRLQFFVSTFKKMNGFDDRMAELVYERAVIHIQNKDFDLALESLEQIKKKHKKSAFLPKAELEIGRVLLITNKTDDALDLLTSLPQQFPDHPILDRVYLNLGDHYFRSQQYENAIVAFKRVIESHKDQTAVPLAMRYLIRIYESLRMYDAGLATTRQYLEWYPNADDVLQKRVQIGLFQMRLKEYNRAIDQFRKVKPEADAETEAEVQYWIGKCYEEMGQFQQAVFEYLKVKYLSRPTKLPWASTALFEAAKSYQRMREYQKSKKLFQDIVRTEGATSDLGRIARQKIEEINTSLANEGEGIQ